MKHVPITGAAHNLLCWDILAFFHTFMNVRVRVMIDGYDECMIRAHTVTKGVLTVVHFYNQSIITR